MRIPILVEPIENGRFRAHAGEPFALSEEGATTKEATDLLAAKLQERVTAGATLSYVDVFNGTAGVRDSLAYVPTLVDDWFFGELEKEILENRRQEAEAEEKRWAAEGTGA